MKIYLNKTVYDAALERIEWVFNEFPNVTVGVSGGKDSTILFNLGLEVARKLNRLPLNVMFIDQEAEWSHTIDIMRKWMYHPDVKPYWFQFPFRISNSTTFTGEFKDHWLWCWEEGKEDEWLREREPIAITKRPPGEDGIDFNNLFHTISRDMYPNEPHAYISGVRAEESPKRFIGLTSDATYKYVTWGKIIDKKLDHYTFYPIYDWSYLDVWKAIHDNGWEYNHIYDLQYQYGVPTNEMRVSNLHHETAVKSLFHLQDLDPEVYEKLTKRIKGIDTAGKMGKEDYFVVKKLPYMFGSWEEYRDYLLAKLINDKKWRDMMADRFAKHDEMFKDNPELKKKAVKTHINSIMVNDWEGIKLINFQRNPKVRAYLKGTPFWAS